MPAQGIYADIWGQPHQADLSTGGAGLLHTSFELLAAFTCFERYATLVIHLLMNHHEALTRAGNLK